MELSHSDVCLDPLGPIQLLQRTLRVFPERTGVVHGDLRWSYARLGEEVGRLAGALRRVGIGAGDRVAVLLPNTPIHLAAHFALPLLQAPLVSINTRLAPAEIAYILEHSGSRLLLVDPELAPPLDDVLPGLPALEKVIEIEDLETPAREGASSYAEFTRDAPVLPSNRTSWTRTPCSPSTTRPARPVDPRA